MQTRLAFAVIDEDTGKIVGPTSLYHIDPPSRAVYRLHIRRPVSTAHAISIPPGKIMLLDHAFDTLNCRCVCWQTDNLNTASQRAYITERLARTPRRHLCAAVAERRQRCDTKLNTARCVEEMAAVKGKLFESGSL